MCGIAGIVSPNGQLTPGDAEAVRVMAILVRHRGPDEFRIVSHPSGILATRRLAIVDIATGQQPKMNDRRTATIAFNGEIYNHNALRDALVRRGHRFQTRSEAEVCLDLYKEYGPDFIQRLEGQFSIAIWDEEKKALLLARDRLGICPLFYGVCRDRICFSSEVKAVLSALPSTPQLDPRGLAQGVCFKAPHPPTTMFRDVSALPPGHAALFDRSGFKIRQYWDVAYPRDADRQAGNIAAEAEHVRELLVEAVRKRVPDEVASGTFLSGGIDSGLVTYLFARESGLSKHAYTITSPHGDLDESMRARRAASVAQIPLIELRADDDLVARNFESLIWHAETPMQITEAVAMLKLAQVAKPTAKVVLTGEGSDEAFAGYWGSFKYRVHHYINETGPPWLRRFVRPRFAARYGRGSLVPSEKRLDEIRSILGCIPIQVYEHEFYRDLVPLMFGPEWSHKVESLGDWGAMEIARDRIAGRHWIDQALYLGYKIHLPDYLLAAHGDRALMASGVEGRYPYLDRQLVEYAVQIHPRHKVTLHTEKFVLRKAASAWLPQDMTASRKKAFATRMGTPFVGSSAPESIRDLYEPKRIAAYGYFDPSLVQSLTGTIETSRGNPRPSRNPRHANYRRWCSEIAMTLVVSTQRFHRMFLTDQFRSRVAEFCRAHGDDRPITIAGA